MSATEIIEWAILVMFMTWPIGALLSASDVGGTICGIFFDVLFFAGVFSGIINSTMLPSMFNMMLMAFPLVLLLRLFVIYHSAEVKKFSIFRIIKTAIVVALMILLVLNIVTIGMDRGMELTGVAGLVAKLLEYNSEDSFVLKLMGVGGVVFSVIDTTVVAVISQKGFDKACMEAAKEQVRK